MSELFAVAEAAFGGIDVLVNNAGVMTLSTTADTDDATFDRQIAINLKGTFNILREAAKRLRDNGRIINFSSSVVALLQPTYGVYAATKAGVEAMTSIFAKELRGRNIIVNSVAPARPPYLCPYFAAKAAMDSLAVSYASELVRWGIETSIIVSGAFTKGTNHFAHSG